MKKLALITAFVAFGLSVQSVSAQEKFGEAFEIGTAMAPGRLDHLMTSTEKLEDVQMTGYVKEVCQKEGCWLRLSTDKNGNDELFVKMKDHAFLLPKDIAGKHAVILGNVSKKVVSVKEQQHYLEDAGASAEEIAKITEPKESYQMEAAGVILLDK